MRGTSYDVRALYIRGLFPRIHECIARETELQKGIYE